MFKQLMITEIEANRDILAVSLALNLVLFFALGVRGSEDSQNLFTGITMLSYWVLLIIAAANAGHEKRNRLYAELPVTTTESFLVGWLFVIAWLCIQMSVWFLFAAAFTVALDAEMVESLLGLGVNAVTFILIISIGIDLGSFRPKYVQWIYILVMAALLALALIADAIYEVGDSDLAFNSFPNLLMDRLHLDLGASVLVVMFLLAANYFVFRNSDHYLN